MENEDYISSKIQQMLIMSINDQIFNRKTVFSQLQNKNEELGTKRNVMTTDTTTILGFLTLGKNIFNILLPLFFLD